MFFDTRRILMLVLALGVAACDADRKAVVATTDQPRPGTLVVTLSTPFPDDGAVLFELEGIGEEEVRAAEGIRLFTEREGSTLRIAALGAGLGGPLVSFDVADTRNPAAYRATPVEVADERNRARASLDGYRLEVAAAH